MPPLSSEARRAKEEHYARLVAEMRAKQELARQEIPPPPIVLIEPAKDAPIVQLFEQSQQQHPAQQEELQTHREAAKTEGLVWNADQQRGINFALSGQSFVFIGAAGTGKTTSAREMAKQKLLAGQISPFRVNTKWLQAGLPSIVVLSFTNKAVANIRRGMPKDFTCITAHKLIEFEPHFYEVQDADGNWVKTMRFEPSRNKYNKLPHIDLIIFEESSTISVPLFQQIMEALPDNKTQFIFLGDIQQLPPIYGPAILGFKMLELPVVELKEVYRQADDSPILSCAWTLLEGKPLDGAEVKKRFDTPDKFSFFVWKKIDPPDLRVRQTFLFMKKFYEEKKYNPIEDMILMPFNKAYGTIEVNKNIADFLGKERKALVHEIIAGFRKFYYAIGDKVLVNKQEAIVTEIKRNANYVGKEPLAPSDILSRWGHYNINDQVDIDKLHENEMSLEELELMLSNAAADSGEIEERKNQASHVMVCKMLDSEEEVELRTTGDFNECLFAYALTVHKAQGSEWKRVFLFFDHSHATMISREMLYTAITRARESLTIFGQADLFKKGILRQRIKGNTLEEKAEYFKGKLDALAEMEESNGNGEGE